MLTILFFSCEEDKNKIPEGVLQPEEMSGVMSDMHLIEADVLERKLSPDSSDVILKELYLSLFDIKNITPEQFQLSYNYYRNNPEQYQKVYEEVKNELSIGEEKAHGF